MTRLFGDEPDWMTEGRVKAEKDRERKHWLQEVFADEELSGELERRKDENIKKEMHKLDRQNKEIASAYEILKKYGIR